MHVNKKKPELQVFRVIFGVSSSPFLLNATIKFHLEHYLESNEDTVQKLLRSTYVDDIITGADSEDAALCTGQGHVPQRRNQRPEVFDQF